VKAAEHALDRDRLGPVNDREDAKARSRRDYSATLLIDNDRVYTVSSDGIFVMTR
jgi:hypothetical protein